MKLKLISAEYENFKKIRSLTVKFSDKTSIYWRNKGGKSTIFDGVNWCLFGKDSHNKKDFDIKTKIKGKVQHHLDYRVLTVLEIGGVQKSFERILKEKWTKKTGAITKALTSHTTAYTIDGDPKSAGEYEKQISEIIDKSTFRMLTDARYFNEQMSWEERQNILKEISDELDIKTVEGYKNISLFLEKMSLKKQKKAFKLEITKIEDKIVEISPSIKENKRFITDDQPPQGRLQQGKLRGEQDDCRREITALKNDSGTQERNKKIAEIETEIINKQNSFSSDQQIKLDPVFDKINVINSKISRLNIFKTELFNEVHSKKESLQSKTTEIELTRNEWTTIEGGETDFATHCPVCKQSLPDGNIERATEEFNLNKSNKLEELSKKGKELVVEIANLKTEISNLESRIKEKEDKQPEFKNLLENLNAQKEQINSASVDTSELEIQKEGLLEAIKQQAPVDTSEFELKIKKIDDEIEEERQLLSKVENNKIYQDRIEELEKQEKELSQKVADIESKVFDIDNFILAEAGSLEELVNKKFEFAKYSLFKPLINGGVEPRCIALGEDGEEYPSVNNAQQTQLGVDTIKTLQKHYNFFGPIWIDNRESITEIPETDCQTISLFVSPEDEKLRVS